MTLPPLNFLRMLTSVIFRVTIMALFYNMIRMEIRRISMSTCPQEVSEVPEPSLTLEERIIVALEEYENETTPAKYYIRPLCHFATLCVSKHAENRRAIQISCPEDEERRARINPALLSGGTNQISLYPLTKEAYSVFSEEVQSFPKGEGEYIRFTRNDAGHWEEKKFT